MKGRGLSRRWPANGKLFYLLASFGWRSEETKRRHPILTGGPVLRKTPPMFVRFELKIPLRNYLKGPWPLTLSQTDLELGKSMLSSVGSQSGRFRAPIISGPHPPQTLSRQVATDDLLELPATHVAKHPSPQEQVSRVKVTSRGLIWHLNCGRGSVFLAAQASEPRGNAWKLCHLQIIKQNRQTATKTHCLSSWAVFMSFLGMTISVVKKNKTRAVGNDHFCHTTGLPKD